MKMTGGRGLLLLTLLVADPTAALAGADPVSVGRDDQANFWTPSLSEVTRLDTALRVPERMGGPISRFNRLYTGVYRDGHRILVLEGFATTGQGTVRIVQPKDMPALADGGCQFLYWSKDLTTNAHGSDIVCGAYIPPPLPPPSAGSSGSAPPTLP
jgi:hypothetical protein